jgi:ATP-dependent DNA helicase RecG
VTKDNMKENNTLELKQIMTADIKKEIIAFANSEGGTLYIGVDDSGRIVGVDNADEVVLQLTNMLRDGVRPDIMMFVNVSAEIRDGKQVVAAAVQRGTARPYYIKEKGLRPEGVYVRQGAVSVPASESAIRQMIKDTDGDKYEEMRSFNQNLDFETTSEEFKKHGMNFGKEQMRTLGLVNTDGLFTNLGLLFSDQNPYTIKAAVFEGTSKTTVKDRFEFTGSLLKQLNETYQFIDRYNRTRAEFSGLHRIDMRDYPESALREALLNAIVHRDYAMGGSTLVSIFDDRIEIVSIGGLIKGLTVDDIMLGISLPRNERLANIFYRLKLIEAYGFGMQKIFGSYEGKTIKPQIESTNNAFKVVLPNVNEIAAGRLGLNDNENAIMELLDKEYSVTRAKVQETLSLSQSMSIRLLKQLTDKGHIKPVGNGKNRKYIKLK